MGSQFSFNRRIMKSLFLMIKLLFFLYYIFINDVSTRMLISLKISIYCSTTHFKQSLYIVLPDPMNVRSFTSKRVVIEKVKRFLLNGTYYPYERPSHLTAFVKVRQILKYLKAMFICGNLCPSTNEAIDLFKIFFAYIQTQYYNK